MNVIYRAMIIKSPYLPVSAETKEQNNEGCFRNCGNDVEVGFMGVIGLGHAR